MDGNAVNRRQIKMHDDQTELVYKTPNPFADDGRDFFFFSDPPHLIKTIQNCWKQRWLWVFILTLCNMYPSLICFVIIMQCNGKDILWRHLQEFYKRDTAAGQGVRMIPKIKFEHISLNSFSKMRVDLAAQVS